MSFGIRAAESGWLPRPALRWGIRRLLAERLRETPDRVPELAAELATGPLVLHQKDANQQHYELPASFFELVLGHRLKYSCGFWSSGESSLDGAEEAMLDLTCRRAEIEDGMTVLDLGCGWGALSLWIAQRYPRCRVLAVSNSRLQRGLIEGRVHMRGLENVEVVTCDVAALEPRQRFDRVISVEMFEHFRNYRELLRRIERWLTSEGRLFVHVFCHRRLAYPFETDGERDWMGRTFFTGGLMPSFDLFDHFQDRLRVERRWMVDGTHYRRTVEAWLANLDARESEVREVLLPVYGKRDLDVWVRRWQIFFLSCAELFGFRGGREWGVGHYLFRPASAGRSPFPTGSALR